MNTKRHRRPLLLPLLLPATVLLLLLLLCPLPSAAASPSPSPSASPPNSFQSNNTDYIRTSCSTTLYPEICYTSLSRYASAIQQDPGRLARVAIGISLSKARHMAAYLSNVSKEADYGSDHRSAAALHDCFTNMDDAVDEIRGSLKQMRQLGNPGSPSAESFRFQMSNVQTWMSAALTDEDTCTDGFEDVADGPVKADVCDRAADVKKFTSNALALVNSYASRGIP